MKKIVKMGLGLSLLLSTPLFLAVSCSTTEPTKNNDLVVNPVAAASQFDISTAIEYIKTNPTMTDKTALLAVLNPLFSSLKLDDLANLTVTVVNNAVVLTANQGYTIDGKASITSSQLTISTNLVITVKTPNQPEIHRAINLILKLDSGSVVTKLELLNALVPLFDGLNPTNLAFVTPSLTNEKHTIKLTAINGYTINDSTSIDAVALLKHLPIQVNKSATQPQITAAITYINANPEAADKAALLNVLTPLFDGLDSTNLAFVTVSISQQTEQRVTLTAKPAYIFTSSRAIHSNSIFPNLTTTVNTAATEQEITAAINYINANPEAADKAALLNVLTPLFTNLSVSVLNNVATTVVNNAVVLTANQGYTIDGKASITSISLPQNP